MPKRRKRKKKHWSYNAGERGRNWVRAYQQRRDKKFYLEWRETDESGKSKRRSILLKDVTTQKAAKAKADALAARFAEEVEKPEPEPEPIPVSITSLLADYLEEVTPRKGESAQDHDRRAARIWKAYFEMQADKARRPDRHPETLDRIDWDGFIECRRSGKIPGWKNVADRAVEYDLKFMVAVLTWGLGTPMLKSHPWGQEVRKAQNWQMPKEQNPKRPGMPNWIREGLITHSSGWQFKAMLGLERETRRRNSAIRRLDWSDVDQDEWTVRWRGEQDKSGKENVTPLTRRAIEILTALPSRGISGPVFPAARAPQEPTPRGTCQNWLRKAKAAWLKDTPDANREKLKKALHRVGFHAQKRQGIRDPEFRKLPPKIQEEFSGTSWEMIRRVYDEVTVEDMREAMALETGSNCEQQLRATG